MMKHMPKNQLIRWGIIGLIACALLWAGNKFLIFVEPALPYAGGVALLMIIVGTFWEMRKPKPMAEEAKTEGE